ncbi:MAG: DUF192 domain-containing protein [Candidatus Thermoplasmatota archaeon]
MEHRKKDMMVYIGVVIVVSILVIWLVFYNTNEEADFEGEKIVVTNSAGEEIELSVEIADTDEEQRQGLMEHDSLCEHCGMLFVYEEDVHYGFWMKDTQIPLSIAFISENGTIMEIQQMEPETTETHRPEEPYRYALEVNQGFFQENQVNVGDEVSIPEQYE